MTGWGQKFSLADTDRDGDLSETEREQALVALITVEWMSLRTTIS